MALHKVTGKIILVFIALHIFFYANLFVQFGIFWNSIKSSYIVVALISAGILFTLGITSIQFFRRMNYSWFYKIHVVGSTVVLPLLYFHVKPLRIYLLESAGVIVMNAGYRMLSSRSKTM
jgi:DMSO/TMAO reductase YedYZ heme-binding membrane subunit